MVLIVVCGGAGYIGSHVTGYLLRERKFDIRIIDNLSTGHIEAYERLYDYFEELNKKDGRKDLKFDFHKVDVRESEKVIPLLKGAACVIHLCAFSLVGESMTNIPKYYDNNVYGATKLIEAIRVAHVPGIVFSSTAACYGEPKIEDIPLKETAPCHPVNVYGETKLCMEQMIRWQTKDTSAPVQLKAVALRYFNVCGAGVAGECDIGEDHFPETHLVPNIIKMVQQEKPVRIFGNDYLTRDGTCVRDYIDVGDLAMAHIKAVESIVNEPNVENFRIFNVGTKQGSTVLEIVNAFEKIIGKEIQKVIESRRAGDPATLIADANLAKVKLNWEPKTSLEQSLRSAYMWHNKNQNGYSQ